MKDKLKKAFLIGIGAMATTGEKIDELVDELVAKGDVTAEEGKKILDEYKEKVKANQQDMSNKAKEELSKMLDKMNLATKKDLEEIKARLDAIEQKLNGNPQ
jgi:polyhydroxyalkanoate synthesis regulator phasin